MKHANCAFNRSGECLALEIDGCMDKCSFYKSAEQRKSDIVSTHERLKSLPESEQNRIIEKYYGGVSPWQKSARQLKTFLSD